MGLKILFYPNNLAGGQRVMHYLKELGVDYTNDINDPGITHAHYYEFKNERVIPDWIHLFMKDGKYVINNKLTNIKKDHIDDVFTDVFGYSLRVNPTTHRGICVKRSSQNALHQGELIQCPIKPWEVDMVPRTSGTGVTHYRIYTRLIDTRIDQDIIRDFRVVVMGYDPVFLFEKHMSSKGVFHPVKGGYYKTYGYVSLSPSFTQEEIDKIREFIIKANVDFGEIDILKSAYDGRIYICDINDIPGGVIFNTMDDGDETIKYLAEKYKQTYLS